MPGDAVDSAAEIRRTPSAQSGQEQAPYLDALVGYAGRDPGRFNVPGHKGGGGADPALVDAFGAPELDQTLGIAHCLTPDSLAETLDRTPGAIAALTVSPTYFGAVADVRGLADVAHGRGVPLVVDEAWGAHLRFSPLLPPSAL